MTIKEVFPNPTVKQVIFQICFPNLFFMENKIGEFQIKIMDEFPESALLFRKQLVFTDLGPKSKMEEMTAGLNEDTGNKIWQFKSPKKIELNVLSNSLDINSQFHKTYKNPGSPHKFRDIIEFVLEIFFKVTGIPLIHRIGLRYIDECPIPAKSSEAFLKFYNTSFPLKRFNLEDAEEMEFKTVIKKDSYSIRYGEVLKKVNNNYKLQLDFDGFAVNIKAFDYLAVTDALHDLIANEFERTIKEPVYDYMRNP